MKTDPPAVQLFESRPTYIEVDLGSLSFNYGQIRQGASMAKIMAIVKANAYGHGLLPCAKYFEKLGLDYLGVAYLEEGVALRQGGLELPILVLGGIVGAQIRQFIDFDLDITASSVPKLDAIEEVARNCGKVARVHLKIDTGMERIGVHYYNSCELFSRALKCKHCEVVGVCSHFAHDLCSNESFTELQLERFLEAAISFKKNFANPPLLHIANSAALPFLRSHLDMLRPGLALYGVYPHPELSSKLELRPALSLRSCVVYTKIVKRSATVSYGGSWRAPEDSRVLTVPMGYGDGYSRALSNRAEVLIRGRRYSVVGQICMDQLMVSVGMDDGYNGDEVVLIGGQGEEHIGAEELSALLGTTPHEVLVALNERIPRRYVTRSRDSRSQGKRGGEQIETPRRRTG